MSMLPSDTPDTAPAAPQILPVRVLKRTAIGLWQQKRSLAAGAVVVAALGAYSLGLAPGTSAAGQPAAGGTAAPSDTACADTVIATITHRASANPQQAYQCFAPAYQQQLSEQQFANQLQASVGSAVTKVARVGTYRNPSGESLVYYAADTPTQSLGFIVYVGEDGKVFKIE